MQNNHGKVVHMMSPLCCCQVEVERLRREEDAASAAREKEQLGQIVRGLEQELAEKQDECQAVQVRGCWVIDRNGAGVTLQTAPHQILERHLEDSDRELKVTTPLGLAEMFTDKCFYRVFTNIYI